MQVEGAAKQFGLQMQREREAEAKERSGVIRASSIGQCSRRIGYGLLGYQPAPESGQTLFTFRLGSAIHDVIQRQLVAMGWIKAKPVLTPDGRIGWMQDDDALSGCELEMWDAARRLVGHPDGITIPLARRQGVTGLDSYYPDPKGERYLVEIKSMSDRPRFWLQVVRDGGTKPLHESDMTVEFITPDAEIVRSGECQQRLHKYSHLREVVSGQYGPKLKPVYKVRINGVEEAVTVLMTGNSQGGFSSLSAPKSEHVAQASLYAAHFGIARVMFIYVSKEAQGGADGTGDDLLSVPIKIFEQAVEAYDLTAIYAKAARIYAATDAGELPEREFDWNAKRSECRRCPFAWQCWPDKVNSVALNRRLRALGLEALTSGIEPPRKAA